MVAETPRSISQLFKLPNFQGFKQDIDDPESSLDTQGAVITNGTAAIYHFFYHQDSEQTLTLASDLLDLLPKATQEKRQQITDLIENNPEQTAYIQIHFSNPIDRVFFDTDELRPIARKYNLFPEKPFNH